MRFDRSYEDTENGRIYSTEAVYGGNYYGWGYYNIRWKSAQDGRTPMFHVELRLFNRSLINCYFWRPEA